MVYTALQMCVHNFMQVPAKMLSVVFFLMLPYLLAHHDTITKLQLFWACIHRLPYHFPLP